MKDISFKKIIIRIVMVVLGAVIVANVLSLFATVAQMKYKYLDYDNNWGVSSECWLEYGQCYCKLGNGSIKVQQYYEVNNE